MSFSKEMILFGSHGADHWMVSRGAWDQLLKLLARPRSSGWPRTRT